MAANSASNGSDTPFWPQWPPNHTSTTSTSTTHRHTQYTFRNLRLRPLCVCMFTLLFFTQGANLSRVYASSYLLTEMPRSAERMLTPRWCVLTMKPSEDWRHGVVLKRACWPCQGHDLICPQSQWQLTDTCIFSSRGSNALLCPPRVVHTHVHTNT